MKLDFETTAIFFENIVPCVRNTLLKNLLTCYVTNLNTPKIKFRNFLNETRNH